MMQVNPDAEAVTRLLVFRMLFLQCLHEDMRMSTPPYKS
jgi:hypothetical protein